MTLFHWVFYATHDEGLGKPLLGDIVVMTILIKDKLSQK